MEERKEWIVMVAQTVVGKPNFPHRKLGTFKRFKLSYTGPNVRSRVIFARGFIGLEELARKKAEKVADEMFQVYVFGMGDTSITCVEEYTVVLHNVTEDVSSQISTTVSDNNSEVSNYLYEDLICNNITLGELGIVKGLR